MPELASPPPAAEPCAPRQARFETAGSQAAAARARAPAWRERVAAWIEARPVQNALIALILVNAVILGLETFPALRSSWGDWLRALDQAILAVFVVELALRLLVHRMAFLRDPWSVFDLVVVGIALMPASGAFAVLRALRVLRVMRLRETLERDRPPSGAATQASA